MVEEGTFNGGPKCRGKEELGEEEWDILSLKKTEIWQDYSTLLEFKRKEEKRREGAFFLSWNEWKEGYI